MEKKEQPQQEAYSFSCDESKKAAEKAMSLLLFKDRTKKELSDKLYRAGYSERASEEAMEYVEHFGYIDDRRYAANYLMFQKEKRSKKELFYKLSEKGIDHELVCRVMEEEEYEGEETAVEVLVNKRLKGRKTGELTGEEKNKLIAYLGRKGYEYTSINNVLSKLDNFG